MKNTLININLNKQNHCFKTFSCFYIISRVVITFKSNLFLILTDMLLSDLFKKLGFSKMLIQ